MKYKSLTKNDFAQVVCRCFGEAAYMMASQVDAVGHQAPQQRSYLSLSFHGYSQGELVLSLTESTVQELALNTGGFDSPEEIQPEDLEDAFCEFGNVLMGHVLTECFGPDQDLRVGLPFLMDPATVVQKGLESENWASKPGHWHLFLDIESEPAEVFLWIE